MKPLAERMRPQHWDHYVGQHHLIDPGAPLRRMIEAGSIPSMILWGPPGVGKTTLARLISTVVSADFYTLSAVGSGVADVRKVIAQAQESSNGLFGKPIRPILFIDEIHRFSKSQQDSLLSAVESGIVTLVGATTENPSFEVIRPLLSRCQVFVLQPVEQADLQAVIDRALTDDEGLSQWNIQLNDDNRLIEMSGGDVRRLLNLLEMVVDSMTAGRNTNDTITITAADVLSVAKTNPIAFDKGGELHYDIASAFIKSIRGSDPDAAIYWMARLIQGGEDPRFVARRVVISAAEDVGLANPNALVVANAAAQAVDFVGWPEGRIPLAEAVVYLAASPKSNSAYNAVNKAMQAVSDTGNLPVPLHLRNAPTKLMGELGYGVGYKYAHNYPNHYVKQQYLPDELIDTRYYEPQNTAQAERNLKAYLQHINQEPQE